MHDGFRRAAIDPLQFMGIQLQLEDKTIDSSSQEDKNLLFCPPDEAVLTSHARGLFAVISMYNFVASLLMVFNPAFPGEKVDQKMSAIAGGPDKRKPPP
ncbi:hypothetical protein AC249_AIPGENE24872 [Exaiptasia diaphana]|nr:hypothetical protein AC249_AIPGENE24872 [Exaiptasia diaphana]